MKNAERLRKDLKIPLYGFPPPLVVPEGQIYSRKGSAAPGDVIRIYWAGSPGPASEKFYWRATVEEDDKGHLCVTAPGWDECVSFNPDKDWWVMYEKKSRKRSRDDDDGVQSSPLKRFLSRWFQVE